MSTAMSTPMFAVVGHPNKGKSSIVATLAQDDSVGIAPASGTTTQCRHFPMKVDGQTMYVLVDTPGFQRARRALAWMREHEGTAAQRPAVVKAFVEAQREAGRFTDECELLTPILEGAGIIYVVDGSRPYGDEYEAEMDILRWTGRPSMALINPISDSDHIEEWRIALGQYFKIVRVFNAMSAEFYKRTNLLEAFGQLDESWAPALRRAADVLTEDRNQRHHLAAMAIADMLIDMLTHAVEKKIPNEAEPKKYEDELRQLYMNQQRRTEQAGRKKVEQIYDHQRLERQENEFELLDTDLFSLEDWYLWGLSKRQMISMSAGAGAATGAVIDASVGGASFLLGSIAGGLIGGASAWYYSDDLAKLKVQDVLSPMGKLPFLGNSSLGGKRLVYGPSLNRNFPYVILGRALHHQKLVAGRTHAQRDVLELKQDGAAWLETLAADEKKSLEQCFDKLRKGKESEEVRDVLSGVVEMLVAAVDSPPEAV